MASKIALSSLKYMCKSPNCSLLPQNLKICHPFPCQTLKINENNNIFVRHRNEDYQPPKDDRFTTPSTFISHNNIKSDPPSHFAAVDDSQPSKIQKLSVYEFEERDKGRSGILELSKKKVNPNPNPNPNPLGDFIPLSNNIYTGDRKKRLGTTTGLCFFIQHVSKEKGDRYDAICRFYFGAYGNLSVQGPYVTKKDTQLTITGGTGVFEGVYGTVKVHPLIFPFKLFYIFNINGIKDLPSELLWNLQNMFRLLVMIKLVSQLIMLPLITLTNGLIKLVLN